MSEQPDAFDDAYLVITPTLVLPRAEMQFRASRSSGPGGQHVNKVETRVEVRFNVRESPALTEEQRARLAEALASRLDEDGELRVVSERYRSQYKNREDAVVHLVSLLQHALRPRKARTPTRIPRAARQARLDEKKRRGAVKRLRGGRHQEE